MSARVFKFMAGRSYHLDGLKNDQVYFSSFDELNDPYEGLMHYCKRGITHTQRMAALTQKLNQDHQNVREARKEADKLLRKLGKERFNQHIDAISKLEFEDFLEYHKSHRFVLSLSKAYSPDQFPDPLVSMMMWGHYGNGMKGLCVEYNFEALRQSINALNEINLTTRKVVYSKSALPVVRATTLLDDLAMSTHQTSNEILNAFCTKQVSWIYENEVRLISPKHKLNDIDETSVTRVFVAAKDQQLMENVVDILKLKTHKPKLFEVVTQPKTYGVGFKEINY